MIDPVLPLLGAVPGLAESARVRRGIEILATTPRPPVGLTPHAVVHVQDKLAVRFYAPSGGKRTPVVIVPSMINRAWIVDLEPGRSLVEGLAGNGHPVYLVDWGVPGPEDAGEDVGYALLELLHRSIDRICRHARAPRAHLFGYCMGGTLAAMYAALRPARVASLVALAAPVKFSEGGRFRDFVAHLDVETAIDADGMVGVETMKPAFKLLDPMGNWKKYLAIEEASHDPRKLARVLVRERWLEENVPMPGAFAREFTKRAYQDDALLAGTWEIRGEHVRLEKITAPTLVVACARDFITPAAAAVPLAGAVSGPARAEVLDTGHIGVVVGAEGPRTFYPLLDRFFREATP
ncbi:MAG: alpha/beta fold hydrolase [Myxococcota bacterium]